MRLLCTLLASLAIAFVSGAVVWNLYRGQR